MKRFFSTYGTGAGRFRNGLRKTTSLTLSFLMLSEVPLVGVSPLAVKEEDTDSSDIEKKLFKKHSKKKNVEYFQ